MNGFQILDFDELETPRWFPSEGVVAEHFRPSGGSSRYRHAVSRALAASMPDVEPLEVLDVGCGDGLYGGLIRRFRPGTRVCGLEVSLRKSVSEDIDVRLFDGETIDFADRKFDVSILCNVLHHARCPDTLMREVARVTRRRIIIKDHMTRGALDFGRLMMLDVLGNAFRSKAVIGKYLDPRGWRELLGSPAWRTTLVHGIPVRRGVFGRCFPNELEVLLTVDLEGN